MTILIRRAFTTTLHYQALYPHSTNLFRSELLQFASKNISREDYLANCRNIVAQLLMSPEYGFYNTGIQQAKPMLELFKEVTAESSFITGSEIDNINGQFQSIFCDALSEKLATDAGQSFYPIPQLAQREEKIHSAQKWTALFFNHLNTLSDLHNHSSLDDLLVQKLREMTVNELQEYAYSIKHQLFTKMITQMERDPDTFLRTFERIMEKAERDPNSLSVLEKEYVDFMQVCTPYSTRNFPDIEKKVRLIQQCITLGHDLQKKKIPISESWDSFAQTLKE